MKIHKNLKINGSRNRPIILDVLYLPNGERKPLVVLCHGFKGFKDWGHFDLLALALAGEGFVICKFNFSHNGGTEEQPIDFPDLEAFGRNTISLELDDLGLIIDKWLEEDAFIPNSEVDRRNLSLIGHSRGGSTAILKCAEDSRIRRLVTWASPCKIGRLFEDEALLRMWLEEGVIYAPNSRTGQQMPMYIDYYRDFQENGQRLDVMKAAAGIRIPWLIIHGDNDATVPAREAEILHEVNPGSRLIIIPGGDHTFGGKHPWEIRDLPADSLKAVSETIGFLKQPQHPVRGN